MILDDIGMLLADTARSRAYLQVLVAHNYLPSCVIVMENKDSDVKPGQVPPHIQCEERYVFQKSEFSPNIPIRETLERTHISYFSVKSTDPNEEIVIEALKKTSQPVFIYGGVGGIILKKPVLSLNKNFLHIHPGAVPAYRGSTPIYYSLLKEGKIFASAFFLKPEIDTGPVLKIKEFPLEGNRTDIDFFIDPLIRASLLLDVIKEYSETNNFYASEQENLSSESENYYIIHPILKHVAILGK